MKQALIEKLVAHPAVEGHDVAVLHWSSRRDVMPVHTLILSQTQDGVRSKLGDIVGNDHLRLCTRCR